MLRAPRVLALCVLLMLAACRHRSADEAAPSPDAPVQLMVTNHYGQPMEVWVAGAGMDQRLGVVNPGTTARYVIPRSFVGTGRVEVHANPPGRNDLSLTARSGSITLVPGAVVEFEIVQPLFNSQTIVR
jgi:hypothetical protein